MTIKNKSRITGRVYVKVFDVDGNLKSFNAHPLIARFPVFIQKWLSKFSGTFTYSGQPMIAVGHNIVTNEGDAIIADLCAETPAQQKVDNTYGHIQVGTGFTSEAKTIEICATPTGDPEGMDATYPVLVGSWGNANDNVVRYRSTFEAGDLNVTGVDEAALMNNAIAASGEALAYAEISPAVNVSTSDTLEVTWELTFTGA